MLDDTLPSPRLPIEVLERIIDSVYELQYEGTDRRDLYAIWKSCALSCHAMAPRSQFWLFHDIALTTETQALNFTKVLRKNAAVAPHVRSLTLSGPDKDEDGRGYTWISWVPLVVAPLMKNLQELMLEADVFRDCHPGLPRALTAFKSIDRLSLYNTHFPSFGHCIRLVRAFSRLRHLTFSYVSWKPDPPSLPHLQSGHQRLAQRKRVQLAHLNILGEHRNVRAISKWLVETEATKFLMTFYGFPEQSEIIRDIAFPRKPTIRTMAFHSETDFSIQIPDSNCLQTMQLQMVNDTFPVQFLTSITAAASSQLREITIYLRVEDAEIHKEPILTEAEQAAYAQLDSALCKPTLQGLRLIVCLYDEEPTTEAWQQKLYGRLPRFCSEEGRLVMKFTFSRYPLWRWIRERDGL